MILVVAALVGLATLASGQTGQAQKDKGPSGKGSGTAKGKSALEKALEQALGNNSDLKVARARVAEAEANLSRARLEVLGKVVAAYQAVEQAKLEVANWSVRVAQMARLRKVMKGTVTDEEFRQAETALALAKMKVARAQTDLDFLTGKVPTALGMKAADLLRISRLAATVGTDEKVVALSRLAAATLDRESLLLARGRPLAGRLATRGPAADRIRKVLDRKVTLKFSGTPASEVLKLLQKESGDLHIQAATKDSAWTEKVTANLTNMPLGAALQLLEDALGKYQIVVREYGLLIVPTERVPRGAVSLTEFWKGGKSETQKPPGKR
jgi:hypothetical protein